ncbi:hypothetical protein OG772_20280 [Streptomyces sp. NBC_01321]|uniref:hypothetical protein n=1 Tax=Streptomyces sp. NBC_01321 TaxID=2903825 RepID=UPI002E168011|nr:hypothetical protein OG772_20280 [Streptomyces sp. NBC_01321]
MSTRAIVARPTEGGGFAGRYLHQDGDPATAMRLLRDFVLLGHSGNVEAATRILLDEHPFGWIDLPDAESDGECFCHSVETASRLDTGLLTHESDADVEYAYVLHPDRLVALAPGGDGWEPIRTSAWTH